MKTLIREVVATARTRKLMASELRVINRNKGRTIKFV